jgi:hypothetical protein
MKSGYLCLLASIILANTTWADSQDRPDLNGVWRLEPSQCELHSHVPDQLTWQIEQTDDAIHLVQRSGDKAGGEWRCGTNGKDCKVKDEGRSAVLNFYYNGAVLVELESEGSNRDNVTKKRISLSKDGSHMNVEIIHVMPTGRPPEKLVLSKQTQ